MTTSPYREATLAEQTGTAAAEMALRLGRPELAVVALDSVQHSLQRQHRYEAAMESARYRLELAKTAGRPRRARRQLRRRGLERVLSRRVRGGSFDRPRGLRPDASRRPNLRRPLPIVGRDTGVLPRRLGRGAARPRPDHRGLGELAEDLTSGFAACWPTAVFVHEARGDHDAANRLLDDVFTVESRRGTRLRRTDAARRLDAPAPRRGRGGARAARPRLRRREAASTTLPT